MGWSKDFEGLRVENRQCIGVGFGDDVLDAVDLVRGVRGRNGESRHVWCQSYTRVVFFRGMGGNHARRAFEESGKLLKVGLAGVAGSEREG